MASVVFASEELTDESATDLSIGLAVIERAAARLKESALTLPLDEFLKERLEFSRLVVSVMGITRIS